MRVIENLGRLSASERGSVMALGNFDGLHVGHQAILAATCRAAKRLKTFPAVLTFSRHPQQILHPKNAPALLTSVSYRLSLMERLGIKVCFLLPFNKKFSRMSAGNFVEEILLDRLKIKGAVLGKDARFGHDRRGDGQLMQKLSRRHGFYFEQIPEVLVRGRRVSSSRIRKLLEGARLKEAGECLGRPFGFFGRVVPGDGRGRRLGFPTANLKLDIPLPIPQGVYAVRVRIIGKPGDTVLCPPVNRGHSIVSPEFFSPWLCGAMNFGWRPTFHGKNTQAVCEVHILNWNKSLLGRILEIDLHSRLRAEKKFDDAPALKEQIQRDVEMVRARWK